MSNPIPMVPSPTSEFQAHFGGRPDSADLAVECQKLDKLCGELLAERDKLREALAKVQTERDHFRKAVGHFLRKEFRPPAFTKEEALAFVDQAPPLEDFIADLEREMRSDA